MTDNNCFGPLILDLIPETKNILLITVLFPGKNQLHHLKTFISFKIKIYAAFPFNRTKLCPSSKF